MDVRRQLQRLGLVVAFRVAVLYEKNPRLLGVRSSSVPG